MNIDFEDSKLATVPNGFDSHADEQSWLDYLDTIAAQQDADEAERFAAQVAYEERKLEQLVR